MTKEEKAILEKERFERMYAFDRGYDRPSCLPCIGVDEAGRGPLAGPVVAAAVLLPADKDLLACVRGVNDSKKLTEKKREALYPLIRECAASIGVGIVDSPVIDEINILNATKQAMRLAIENLNLNLNSTLNNSPEYAGILIDAVDLGGQYRCIPIVKGDSQSLSIAAASVIAKVTRDELMKEYAKLYPEYGFDAHKGYGTEKHYRAIDLHGLTPIHRRSFLSGRK